MSAPVPRLFHLHYQVPDVERAERALAAAGVPLRRRFGSVDGEPRALDPDEPVPEDFRLRLQTCQRGDANVTVAPGPALRFDHFGAFVPDFDGAVGRARAAGWTVTDPDGRRPFFVTPWGFRVEVHREGSEIESTLGDWNVGHLRRAAVAVAAPDEVAAGIERVLGPIPELAVEAAEDGDGASVPAFELGGEAFPGGRQLTVDGLR